MLFKRTADRGRRDYGMEADRDIALGLCCDADQKALVDSMALLTVDAIGKVLSYNNPIPVHTDISERVVTNRYTYYGWKDYMYCYINSGNTALKYVIESICTYIGGDAMSDLRKIQMFMKLLYSPITLTIAEGNRYTWRFFNGRIWINVDKHQIRNMLYSRIISSNVLPMLRVDYKNREKTCDRFYRSITNGDISPMFFSPTFLEMCDDKSRVFCMKTCLYDIKNSCIRKPLPGDLCTLAGEVDPDGTVSEERKKEMMDVLAMWMGGQDVADSYMNVLAGALSEFVPRYAIINSGTGADGKSTFFHVVDKLFGSYCMIMPTTGPSADSKSANEATPVASAMVGRRVCITTDANNIDRLVSSSAFKAISGGDKTYIRRLYSEADTSGQRLKMLVLVATNQADFVVASIHELTRVRIVKWLSKRVSAEDKDIIPSHQIAHSGTVINRYEDVFIERYGPCMMMDLISRHIALMNNNMQIYLCNRIRHWTRDTICPKTILRFLAACTEQSTNIDNAIMDDATRMAVSLSTGDMSESVEDLYMSYMIWRRGGARFSPSDPKTMEAFRTHLEFYHRIKKRKNMRGEEELYVDGLRLKHAPEILGMLQQVGRAAITNPIIYTDINVCK
jgi:hypothetical protein